MRIFSLLLLLILALPACESEEGQISGRGRGGSSSGADAVTYDGWQDPDLGGADIVWPDIKEEDSVTDAHPAETTADLVDPPDADLDTDPADVDPQDVEDAPDTEDTPDVEDVPDTPDTDVEQDVPDTEPDVPPGLNSVYGVQTSSASLDCATDAIVDFGAVTLTGVVATSDLYDVSDNLDGFFVRGPESFDLYNGLQVVVPKGMGVPVSRGDQLDIEGWHKEYYCSTEVSAEVVTIVGPATTPQPVVVSAAALAETDPQTEAYEGMLVQVQDLTVTALDSYEEIIADGVLRIGNTFDVTYLLDGSGKAVGDHLLSVTGVVIYRFGHYVLLPRVDEDIQVEGFVAEPQPETVDTADMSGTPSPYEGVVVINEMMLDPHGPQGTPIYDSDGEWIELVNTSGAPLSLEGWTIKDQDYDEHLVSAGVTLPAYGYVVLGASGDTSLNGGVDVADAWGNDVLLSNTSDEVILLDAEGREVDRVEYVIQPWPDPKGASFALKDPGLDNNTPLNWALSSHVFDSADHGTPGQENFDVQ
jgi:hypothetical protein